MLVLHEALRVREPADEPHEEVPLPVPAGIGVIVDSAALERIVRVGHLVVADDVMPVDRDQRAARDHGGEACARAVLRKGESRRVVGEPHVLDPDRANVVCPVAGVPGDVVQRHELLDLPVAPDDEVGRGVGARVAQPRDRAEVGALGHVDDDEPDGALRALGLRVVRLRGEVDTRRLRAGRSGEREGARQEGNESEEVLHEGKTASEPRPL